jgi:hypothetical protein
MALTRAYVRCFAAMQLELDDILVRVNQMLLKDLEHGHFVTLFLASLNPDRRSLSYASAGHVPGFIFLDSGQVKCTLDSTGPPLGLFSGSKFSLRPAIPLDPERSRCSSPTELQNRLRLTDTNSDPSVCLTTFRPTTKIRLRTLRMAFTMQLGHSCRATPRTTTSHPSSSRPIVRWRTGVLALLSPKRGNEGNPFASNFFLAPGS